MSAFQHFPLGRGEAMGMLVDFYNLANGTRFERRPETFWNRRIGRLIENLQARSSLRGGGEDKF